MRRLGLTTIVLFLLAARARAQDALPPPSRPDPGGAVVSLEHLSPAPPDVQDAALGVAEQKVLEAEGHRAFHLPEPGPFGGNGSVFTGWSDTHTWKPGDDGGLEHTQSSLGNDLASRRGSTSGKIDEIRSDPRGAAKGAATGAAKGLATRVMVPVVGQEQNALSFRDAQGNGVDVGHLDESFQVGLTGVAGQVDFSVVDAHEQLGDVGLEGDALTAKARVQLSLTQGVDLQAGATLVEGSADLGGVEGSVGLGVGADVAFSPEHIGFKIGLGVQVSVGVNPLEIVHTVGDLAGDAAHATSAVAGAVSGFVGGLFGGDDGLERKIEELKRRVEEEARERAAETARAQAAARDAPDREGGDGIVQRVPHIR